MTSKAMKQGERANQAHEDGATPPPRSTTAHAVLKILDSTKSNKEWFDSRGLIAGYHTVVVDGERYVGQRDSARRMAKVPIDFTGKRVLDIGCSNGGLLHHLSDRIAFGAGVDFNAKCINGANVLKAANGIANVHFYAFDLDKEDLALLDSFVLGQKVDVCFILNISLWVKRWQAVVKRCATLTDTVVFEAHGTAEQQSVQHRFMASVFTDITLVSEHSDDDPTYAKRSMYLCQGLVKAQPPRQMPADGGLAVLEKVDPDSIRAAYLGAFPSARVERVHVYPNTHESTVAELDHEFIVKFPRRHRGSKGIGAEKQVTDLIRGRVAVRIPEIELFTSPVLFASYRKLDGQVFDRNIYRKLDDKDKDALAGQLADFMRAMHAVSAEALQQVGVALAPSWTLSTKLMEQQLSSIEHRAIRKVLPEVLQNQRDLERVTRLAPVLGHFDLHGGNLLLDAKHRQLLGVIDFGNCKLGDPHQDFSAICLSSPDLTERVIVAYELRTGEQINRMLVQHYATAFYLNLLAGLRRNQDEVKFKYWLSEFERWWDHLLLDRARARLDAGPVEAALPASWQKWIASNLMKGSELSALQGVLREKGLAELDAAVELVRAQSHPYVAAGRDICHVLRKREWLLDTSDELARLDGRYTGAVERRPVPDFPTFLRDYYSKQLPVVLMGGVEHWRARQIWTPEYFLANFADACIEAQEGREQDPDYERNASRHKKKTTMGEFARRVMEVGASNDFYMTANNAKGSAQGLEKLFDEDIGDFGPGYRDAKWQAASNFLWFGPKGTFTPLHHDLTNNMMVQIHGRKKVTLIPAFQVPWLYNDVGVFSAAGFPTHDLGKYPLVAKATPMVVEIGPGDALFIPIGWWHCVESLDISIGLSFTNFNAINSFAVAYPR